MGRPLKIAKAQAVLTVTDTAETGSIVTISGGNLTTSPTVGILAGMPFVVATTVGGLTAGTTYYVSAILSNTTFSVATTQPSVQPKVMATMTDTTGQTVKASFAVTDGYFNNPTSGSGYPATNTATYSVVGGNTNIYGNQVLANVAIGVNGTGTVYANASSNSVVGVGTDFANVTTGTILFATGTDGSTNLLGTMGATHGNLVVEIANTAASGNVIGTTGNAQLLTLNTPVKFDATFGNLTAGTTYWVKTIPNAAAFTVSASLGGVAKQLTDNVSVTGNTYQNRAVLGASSSTDAVGLVFVQALPEAGYIVRQKGKTKYLVTGGTTGLTGACYTANVANTALTPNTMTITATYANSATAKVQTVDDKWATTFPATVAVGSLVAGTVYTIYSTGTTNWATVGAASNLTGVTFVATGTGSGTGTAVLANVNTDYIGTFNSAAAANTSNATPAIVSIGKA